MMVRLGTPGASAFMLVTAVTSVLFGLLPDAAPLLATAFVPAAVLGVSAPWRPPTPFQHPFAGREKTRSVLVVGQKCKSKWIAGIGGAHTTTMPLHDALLSPDFTIDPVLIEHIATGGALTFAGDVIAQSLTSEKRGPEKNLAIPPEDWDRIRTAAFVAFGALYTGGAQHFIFGWLNSAFSDPVQRLLLAQFVFIPFCYYPTFLLMVPSLRAGWEAGFGSPDAAVRRAGLTSEVVERLPSTLLRNWCFWLPVQFIQFSFIPTDLQVTYCAAFGVIWNAILSWSTNAMPSSEKAASK